MEKILEAIRDLTEYSLATGLIEKEDVIYTVNSLIGALGIDDYPGNKEEIIEGAAALDRAGIDDGSLLEGILAQILDFAAGKDMLDGSSVVMRDLFDTKIMGIVTPRPSEVIAKFRGIYIRRAGCHDQPLQAREGPQGDRSGQERGTEQLSQVPALRGERGIFWQSEPPGQRKPQDHPDHNPGKSLGIPVFSLCLLQRALHRVQLPPYSHGDQPRHVL